MESTSEGCDWTRVDTIPEEKNIQIDKQPPIDLDEDFRRKLIVVSPPEQKLSCLKNS